MYPGYVHQRILAERSIEFGQDLFVAFVDLEKAFDRVDWQKLVEVLREIGVDWRDRRIIRNLYMGQSAKVRIAEEVTEECKIGRGVRQGCCLSPVLFNIYAESMLREALDSSVAGVKVGGQLIKSVRFADDKAIVARNEDGLQELMDRLVTTCLTYKMKVNVGKTKVMLISKTEPKDITIRIEGKTLDQVNNFKYLGSTLTS